MLLERESAIQSFMSSAASSIQSGKVLLISGEAGIGKTTLLEHMRMVTDAHTKILWSGCDPLFTPQPYAPFHEIAEFLSSQLVELLDSNSSPSKISKKIASTLYASLEQIDQPIIIVIEDVHWADHATLDLLKFLVRRISFLKCMLCLTYRDDEVTLDHPLSSVLSLTPSAHTSRIQLKPLSINAVVNLARNTQHSAEDLHEITAGNPFFITEILASKTNQGLAIPSSIRDAIGSRLTNLADNERNLMLTLSLIPYSIPASLIKDLFGEQGETYAMACVARKLLQCDMLGEFRFRHELARLAALSCLSANQQKKIHKTILESLEKLSITANLAWLTHHAQGALDAPSVLKYAPLAATGAANLGAHKEAALYYQKALKFVEYADTELAASLHENWAYEVSLTTHMDASVIEARRAAITLWRALGRNDKIGENLRSLSRLYWYQGQAERAEHYANDAINIFEKMPASSELAMAYSMRSQLDMLNDRTEDAVFWGEKALALEHRFNSPLVKVHALTNIGTALLLRGDPKGEAMLKESLALSEKHGMHEETARVYTNYSDYSVRYKRLILAEELTNKGIQYDTSHDLDSWTYYLVGIQAQLRLEQGRLIDAETIASGVQKLESQTLLMKLPALIVLARARSRMAKPDAALLLQQALSNALAIDEFQYIIPVRFAIIEHAWLIDDFHQAETHISELRILASSVLNPWQVGELLTWIARMNLPEFEFENVINAQNCVAEPYQLELAGNAKLACERWQALGMPFNAAVALLQSTGNAQQSDYLNAYSLLESLQAKAVMLWIRQRAKQQGFYEKLPKTRRGPYAESRQHPAGLTSKEQQIMTLLITGASNHDIANTLSRSQRTIENHVSSILSKLNVDSRIEAMLRVQNEPWLVEQ
jgi:DNA-binding CsgD family transcriptional regulator/tetratricopeptide (TPR) repeat protein/energy-coupling factor transporter ATP-binding protein EcfA2